MSRKYKHCRRKQQYVRVNVNFITPSASSSAIVVMFLLASMAQTAKNRTIVVKNRTIAERTGLTNITRIMNELYALGVITERVSRYKNGHRYCNAYVLSDAIVNPENYVLVPAAVLGKSLREYIPPVSGILYHGNGGQTLPMLTCAAFGAYRNVTHHHHQMQHRA